MFFVLKMTNRSDSFEMNTQHIINQQYFKYSNEQIFVKIFKIYFLKIAVPAQIGN